MFATQSNNDYLPIVKKGLQSLFFTIRMHLRIQEINIYLIHLNTTIENGIFLIKVYVYRIATNTHVFKN